MAYMATQADLIENCQEWLDADPRYFDQDEGAFTWWGKVVLFSKTSDEITLEYEGEIISFPRP